MTDLWGINFGNIPTHLLKHCRVGFWSERAYLVFLCALKPCTRVPRLQEKNHFPRKPLGIGLRKGTRGVRFLTGEVTLYAHDPGVPCTCTFIVPEAGQIEDMPFISFLYHLKFDKNDINFSTKLLFWKHQKSNGPTPHLSPPPPPDTNPSKYTVSS